MIHAARVTLRLRRLPVTLAAIALFVAMAAWLWWPSPELFTTPPSLAVMDRHGAILRAYLTQDQQLRLPMPAQALPDKYVRALLLSEDRFFYRHPGVNPLSLARAAGQNLTRGQRISGGSTLTMQVIRMAEKRPRTYFSKAIESLSALRLTLRHSKDEVLRLYAEHAPMGGNIVGIASAAWHYCGKTPQDLTWAEAALFAVLPNNPAWLRLDRNRQRLQEKRDRLLRRLAVLGELDSMTLPLALAEPLPSPPPKGRFPLGPAPHLAEAMRRRQSHGYAPTTLDLTLQNRVAELVAWRGDRLKDQGIHNLAVLVAETKTGSIRAYIGSRDFNDRMHQGQVDGVMATRSTGSLLKPLLTAMALDRGPYTLSTRLFDIPSYFGNFTPQNAGGTFAGIISLEDALVLSLNLPFVRLLQDLGIESFHQKLKQSGLRGIRRSPENYGLTLILGGAEASLFDLLQAYSAFAHRGKTKPLHFSPSDTLSPDTVCSPTAADEVLRALRRVVRPESEMYWPYFDDQIPVYWKTGTSNGQKDGWAIGLNAQWMVGVWAGNFEGTGNASLTGSGSAAPLLFRLFQALTDRQAPMAIQPTLAGKVKVQVCAASGLHPSPHCPTLIEAVKPSVSYVTRVCPYHKPYLVAKKTDRAVCSLCWHLLPQPEDTAWSTRLIWPPSVRMQLEKSGRRPDMPPKHFERCPARKADAPPEILYPQAGMRLFLPRDYSGKREKVIFQAAAQRQDVELSWHLNGEFLQRTRHHHQIEAALEKGWHELIVENEEGQFTRVHFEAVQ